MKFGRGPLSHPLFVEAAEELFHPLVIRNNVEGEEARLLARYEEPAWNNPVVRFFAGDGEELLPRKDRVWTTATYAPRLVAALEAARRDVPAWLALARDEVTATRERIVFAMPCFWEGEARLGAIDGVLSTRPAWVGSREVVEVVFDPARVDLAALVQQAEDLKCTLHVFAPNGTSLTTARAIVGERASLLPESGLRDSGERDVLYHLRRRPALFALPATPLQRTRMNAAVRNGRDPASALSPRQRELLVAAEKLAAADLKGLTPPDDLDALPAYQVRFEALLER